ncbi:hypothetical protein B0H11DRAFT_1928344 [Mycena galericulata]|nr:hypothetical protein B0H11DRAFT_1928344 [Mycena galericulata]
MFLPGPTAARRRIIVSDLSGNLSPPVARATRIPNILRDSDSAPRRAFNPVSPELILRRRIFLWLEYEVMRASAVVHFDLRGVRGSATQRECVAAGAKLIVGGQWARWATSDERGSIFDLPRCQRESRDSGERRPSLHGGHASVVGLKFGGRKPIFHFDHIWRKTVLGFTLLRKFGAVFGLHTFCFRAKTNTLEKDDMNQLNWKSLIFGPLFSPPNLDSYSNLSLALSTLPTAHIHPAFSSTADSIQTLQHSVIPLLNLARAGVTNINVPVLEGALNGVLEVAKMVLTMKGNKKDLAALKTSVDALLADLKVLGATGDLQKRLIALSSKMTVRSEECEALGRKSRIDRFLRSDEYSRKILNIRNGVANDIHKFTQHFY